MTKISKTVVPKLRFPGFNDEWEEKTLGELATTVNGLTYSPKNITNSGVLVLRSSNIKSGKLDFSDCVYVDRKLNYNESQVGDILICVRNGSQSLIGKNAYIDDKMPNTTHGAFMTVLRSRHNKYIYQLFQTSRYYSQVNADLGARINSINNSQLLKYRFIFPSNKEQEKIADFLGAVDEKIDLLSKKKELLEKYKKGVMQQMFSQKIRFKNKNGKDFPTWQPKKLGDICQIKKGTQLNGDELIANGDFPMLNGGIKPSGLTDKYNTEANTVTISEGGNSCGYVSYMTQKFWSGGHLYTLQNLRVSTIFLYQILKYDQIKIMRLRVGSGLPNIQKTDLAKLLLIIPSREEQDKIAELLANIDTKIVSEERRLDKAKEFKKALLQQMFV